MLRRITRILFLLAMASAHLPAAVDTPTYNRDIAPVFFGKCAECHHAGGIGPFSLTDFREAKKRAKTILRVIGSRTMPPWPPEPGRPG